MSYELDPNDDLMDILTYLAATTGIPPGNVYLTLNGKILTDALLSNIQAGDTITVRSGLKGGGMILHCRMRNGCVCGERGVRIEEILFFV